MYSILTNGPSYGGPFFDETLTIHTPDEDSRAVAIYLILL